MITPSITEVDVLVIGAGVAGACAALAAAQAPATSRTDSGPRRVMLVERSAWPRDKVCGCCLGGRGITALGELGIDRSELLSRARTLTQVHLRFSKQLVALPLQDNIAIARRDLDKLLVTRAMAAGVIFTPNCSARLLKREPNGWRVALGTENDGRCALARTVIAADGLGGHCLDAVAGTDVHIAKNARIGVGAMARWSSLRLPDGSDALPPGCVVLCTTRDGYAGLVRLQDDLVDIAAALDPVAIKAHHGPQGLIAHIFAASGLSPVGPWPDRFTGTPLLTRRRSMVAAEGLLIIGDAASYVEPFTGEGMTWAACGGQAAGTLAATLPSSQIVAPWERWHIDHILNRQRTCKLVTGGLRIPGMAAIAARLVNTSPLARRSASRVAALISSPDAPGRRRTPGLQAGDL